MLRRRMEEFHPVLTAGTKQPAISLNITLISGEFSGQELTPARNQLCELRDRYRRSQIELTDVAPELPKEPAADFHRDQRVNTVVV